MSAGCAVTRWTRAGFRQAGVERDPTGSAYGHRPGRDRPLGVTTRRTGLPSASAGRRACGQPASPDLVRSASIRRRGGVSARAAMRCAVWSSHKATQGFVLDHAPTADVGATSRSHWAILPAVGTRWRSPWQTRCIPTNSRLLGVYRCLLEGSRPPYCHNLVPFVQAPDVLVQGRRSSFAQNGALRHGVPLPRPGSCSPTLTA